MWKKCKVRVQVYSVDSDRWDKINVNFQFIPSGFANAILNQNPYWLASLDVDNEDVKDLPWLDVFELVFKIIPLASLNLEKEAKVQFVDSRGALVVVAHDINENLLKIIDFWVFDIVEQS
ncbi:hypothetical protein Salat_0054700 [Sesamum alatum]|uniref:F-box associated domain-containing protein n=1 Tax=Sesamum alatum TaxID=300844 RepID=A0AAE2CWN2_9LAMI|nr:hypothetical protein Salat_0054700 [Sesamum alatum]